MKNNTIIIEPITDEKSENEVEIEKVKPFNLINLNLKVETSSPDLVENILATGLGLSAGYLTKKIVVGKSEHKGRMFLGFVLQFGVATIIAQNSKAIKTFGKYIIQNISKMKENIQSKKSEE